MRSETSFLSLLILLVTALTAQANNNRLVRYVEPGALANACNNAMEQFDHSFVDESRLFTFLGFDEDKLIQKEKKELDKIRAQRERLKSRDGDVEELLGDLEDEELALSEEIEALRKLTFDDKFKLFREKTPQKITVAQNRLITIFVTLAKMYGRMPTHREIAERAGLSESEVRVLLSGRLFEGLDGLKKVAMERKASAFKFVVDTEIFTQERMDRAVEAIKNRKRLIVTTAVAGSPVDLHFLDALLTYAETMDAEIFVFAANMQTTGLDPILLHTPGIHIITNDIELNEYWALDSIKIMAKQIKPLTKIDEQGPRGMSRIVGSPKMHLEEVSTVDNVAFPHQIMTTGAITEPVYDGFHYVSGRTDKLAINDHVMGAIILEKTKGHKGVPLETTGNFHNRFIEYLPEKKGFVDLGLLYTGHGVQKTKVDAFVLGDIHVGDTQQQLLIETKNLIQKYKPKYILLHDLFNGHSISHHEREKLITLSQKSKQGLLSLRLELSHLISFLNSLHAIDPSVVLVVPAANHNFWLHRWLQDGQFMKENENRALGLRLATAMEKGFNPLQYAVEHAGEDEFPDLPKLENPKRIQFLELEDSFKVGPRHRLVETALHGDMGANGTSASIKSFERGIDRAVFGHTHHNERKKGVVNVATYTKKVLSYNKGGFSNWSQSMAAVGENGDIQSLLFIDGEYYTPEEEKTPEPQKFFAQPYPRVIPRVKSTTGVGQVDQYGHFSVHHRNSKDESSDE